MLCGEKQNCTCTLSFTVNIAEIEHFQFQYKHKKKIGEKDPLNPAFLHAKYEFNKIGSELIRHFQVFHFSLSPKDAIKLKNISNKRLCRWYNIIVAKLVFSNNNKQGEPRIHSHTHTTTRKHGFSPHYFPFHMAYVCVCVSVLFACMYGVYGLFCVFGDALCAYSGIYSPPNERESIYKREYAYSLQTDTKLCSV